MHMNKKLRPAIAMVELIFALVVMGITLLSAPLILNMSIESSNTAMQQESIAATASEISLVLTQPWDEGDSNATTGFGILNVANGDSELNSTNRLSAFTTRTYNTGANQRKNASASNTFGENMDTFANNDIDDFNAISRSVTLYKNTEVSKLSENEGEYMKGSNFILDTNVTYGNDSLTYSAASVDFSNPFLPAPAGTTNIKLITVTLTDDFAQTVIEHKQSVVLHGFACNIGNARLIPVTMP